MAGVIILEENIPSLRKLNSEDLGMLMKAILDDAVGEEPDVSGFSFSAELLYPIILGSVRRMRKTSETKSAAGRAGAATRWKADSSAISSAIKQSHIAEPYSPNRTEPNHTDVIEGRFAPPTTAEVASYAAEKGIRIDAQRFVDFYASKGWMVGKTKMKDWKAAVRNWAAREKGEKNRFNFDQRGTDYDALLGEVAL